MEAVVAIATLALAAVTAWMARETRRVATATRVQAERAHRPVIVSAAVEPEVVHSGDRSQALDRQQRP